MTADQVRTFLTERQIVFEEKSIQNGTQFRCCDGEIFNVFNTGRLQLQGEQRSELAESVRAIGTGGRAQVRQPVPVVAQPRAERDVFIVYGHDLPCRNSLELLLRRMGLEPIILQNLPGQGDTIIEKLEHYVGPEGNVRFACVLLTPDDEGYPAQRTEERRYRARQNVVLELGMVLARLGRRRVAILHKQTVELPSDIAGLIYIPFQESVEEVRNRLFQELRAAGFDPRADAL